MASLPMKLYSKIQTISSKETLAKKAEKRKIEKCTNWKLLNFCSKIPVISPITRKEKPNHKEYKKCFSVLTKTRVSIAGEKKRGTTYATNADMAILIKILGLLPKFQLIEDDIPMRKTGQFPSRRGLICVQYLRKISYSLLNFRRPWYLGFLITLSKLRIPKENSVAVLTSNFE